MFEFMGASFVIDLIPHPQLVGYGSLPLSMAANSASLLLGQCRA